MEKLRAPQCSYSLERVDPLIHFNRPDHIPKGNKSTEFQGEYGNHVVLQGSYDLDRGNPLEKF